MKPERLEIPDSGGGRGSDRVGDRHRSDDGVVTTDEHCGPSERLPLRTASGEVRGNGGHGVDDEFRFADRDLVTGDCSPGTDPGQGREPLDRGEGAQLLVGGGGDGSGHEVLGCLFERPHPSQQRGPVDAGRHRHVGDRHPPFGDGPGLVEHHGVDLPRGLERLVSLEEDPQAGPGSGGDEQGRRRGQAERAGAGDDQDRDRRAEGVLGGTTDHEPGGEGDESDGEHGGDEDPRDPVGQSLDSSLLVLGILDELHHVGQLCVAPDTRGPDHETTTDRHRSADHLVAGSDVDGYRFAGHGASIDGRVSEDDLAVGGDRLPRPHDKPVSHREPAHRKPALHVHGVEHGHILGTHGRQ